MTHDEYKMPGINIEKWWFFSTPISILLIVFFEIAQSVIGIAVYWTIATLIIWFLKEVSLERYIKIPVEEASKIPEHRKLTMSYGLDNYARIKRRDLFQQ